MEMYAEFNFGEAIMLNQAAEGYDFQAQANRFLMDAAIAGNVAGIKGAIAAGANVNVYEVEDGSRHNQVEGSTPLMRACYIGPDALEAVEALLAAGADVNAKTPDGQNAIISAAAGSARHGNEGKDAEPLIDALINAGAKADDGFTNGKTPLFAAVNEYDAKISLSAIKALLKHGANPNAVAHYDTYSNDILTHVTWSAQQGDELGREAVKALVEAGANVNPTQNPVQDHTSTPIGAAANGSLELTSYFLECGANPNVIDKEGVSLVNATKDQSIKKILQTHLESGPAGTS